MGHEGHTGAGRLQDRPTPVPVEPRRPGTGRRARVGPDRSGSEGHHRSAGARSGRRRGGGGVDPLRGPIPTAGRHRCRSRRGAGPTTRSRGVSSASRSHARRDVWCSSRSTFQHRGESAPAAHAARPASVAQPVRPQWDHLNGDDWDRDRHDHHGQDCGDDGDDDRVLNLGDLLGWCCCASPG